jgi:ABC-2 type transport system ATP-binding protein
METTVTVRDRTRTSAIRVRGLARTFTTKTGPVQAVNGLDFEVREGEIVGLLGPNGAGKTTTLRMIATLLAPTAGEAQIADADLRRAPREVRARIGYVAQGGMANDEELVIDQLVLQARLFGLSKAEAAASAEHLLRTLELDGLGRRRCRELSGGQRRRVDIALGLVHRPRLVYLDEPTTGLDPQSRANLWDHIRSLRDDLGVTVVITTHYLDEADALADRLLVMDHGLIVANDTSEALKAQVSGDVITLELAGDAAPAEVAIRTAIEVRSLAVEGNRVHVTVERGDVAVAPLLRAVDACGLALVSVNVARPTLDDVFLNLTGRSLREEDAA